MAEYGEPLSEREKEVLELVATGATNRQIAQDLVVSVNTVKVHLRNVFTKLGVESRTEATLVAIRKSWVNVPGRGAETEASSPSESAVESIEASAESQARPLPPLPWAKRLALIGSLLIVALLSAITWPKSQTVATPSDIVDDPDNVGAPFGIPNDDSNWRALAPMTTARSRFALVATPNDFLFAIGGETNGGVTDSMERYDIQADRWTLLTANKPTRVSNIGAAIVDGRIYVPGGVTSERKTTDVVEVFDLESEEWHQVAPLPHPLSNYALTTHQEQIYVFGGRDDKGYINTTYIYDPEQDKWREGKTMPTQRAHAAAAALNARIFVIGGYNGQHEQSTCEVYNPKENTWETCDPLILGRGGLGLAAVFNQLYAIGGGWSNYLGFSEKHPLGSKDWVPFETPMVREWRGLASTSTLNKFYVAGGWNGDYLNGAWEYEVLPYKLFFPEVASD